MTKETTFEFRAHSGKRAYSLWLDVDDYKNQMRILGNKIILSGKDVKLNKNSHKDWQKAFIIDESNPYTTIIEFKKGIISLSIDTIDIWVGGRRLILIEGPSL